MVNYEKMRNPIQFCEYVIRCENMRWDPIENVRNEMFAENVGAHMRAEPPTQPSAPPRRAGHRLPGLRARLRAFDRFPFDLRAAPSVFRVEFLEV